MMENKISKETAEKQVAALLDYYELEASALNDDLSAALDMSRDKLIRAVMKGRLEIVEEDGIKITQHTRSGERLEYSELSGRSKIAMGKKSSGDNYGKIYALCGHMTGLGEAGICKLKGLDLSLCEALGSIFLIV